MERIRSLSRRTRERPRRLVVCSGIATLAAAVLVAVQIAAGHTSQATAGTKMAQTVSAAGTFNTNLLLKGSNSAGEPSIRTDQYGNSYVIGPIGVPAGCKLFKVTHDGSGSKFLGFPDHTVGGGDCDLAMGPKETAPSVAARGNDIAYSSLTLANVSFLQAKCLKRTGTTIERTTFRTRLMLEE